MVPTQREVNREVNIEQRLTRIETKLDDFIGFASRRLRDGKIVETCRRSVPNRFDVLDGMAALQNR